MIAPGRAGSPEREPPRSAQRGDTPNEHFDKPVGFGHDARIGTRPRG